MKIINTILKIINLNDDKIVAECRKEDPSMELCEKIINENTIRNDRETGS